MNIPMYAPVDTFEYEPVGGVFRLMIFGRHPSCAHVTVTHPLLTGCAFAFYTWLREQTAYMLAVLDEHDRIVLGWTLHEGAARSTPIANGGEGRWTGCRAGFEALAWVGVNAVDLATWEVLARDGLEADRWWSR